MTCEFCRKPFTPKRSDQIYCSSKCRTIVNHYNWINKKMKENSALPIKEVNKELLEAAEHFRDCQARSYATWPAGRRNGWTDCPDCEKSEDAIRKATEGGTK